MGGRDRKEREGTKDAGDKDRGSDGRKKERDKDGRGGKGTFCNCAILAQVSLRPGVVFRKEWYRKIGKEVMEGRPLLHRLLGFKCRCKGCLKLIIMMLFYA
jgi:hypothetical protein